MERRTLWAIGTFVVAALIMIIVAASLGTAPSKVTELHHPAIKRFGGVAERHDIHERPNPNAEYRVIFDVTSSPEDTRALNAGLDRVARAVNVFADAGVPLDQLHFVAIIHGKATHSILSDATYQDWYNEKNPNTALIEALTKAGVEVAVCGQSLSHLHVKDEEVNPDVVIAPSALSTLAIYGNRGYAYERL